MEVERAELRVGERDRAQGGTKLGEVGHREAERGRDRARPDHLSIAVVDHEARGPGGDERLLEVVEGWAGVRALHARRDRDLDIVEATAPAQLLPHEADVAGAEQGADQVEGMREELRSGGVAEDVPGLPEEETLVPSGLPLEKAHADAREGLHGGRRLVEVREVDLDDRPEGVGISDLHPEAGLLDLEREVRGRRIRQYRGIDGRGRCHGGREVEGLHALRELDVGVHDPRQSDGQPRDHRREGRSGAPRARRRGGRRARGGRHTRARTGLPARGRRCAPALTGLRARARLRVRARLRARARGGLRAGGRGPRRRRGLRRVRWARGAVVARVFLVPRVVAWRARGRAALRSLGLEGRDDDDGCEHAREEPAGHAPPRSIARANARASSLRETGASGGAQRLNRCGSGTLRPNRAPPGSASGGPEEDGEHHVDLAAVGWVEAPVAHLPRDAASMRAMSIVERATREVVSRPSRLIPR